MNAKGSAALWLCVLGLLGVFAVGYPGYFVFDAIWPGYYYSPIAVATNALGCSATRCYGGDLREVLAFGEARRSRCLFGPASSLASLTPNRRRRRDDVVRCGTPGAGRSSRQRCGEQLINLSSVRQKACCRPDCGPSTEGACWLLTLQV